MYPYDHQPGCGGGDKPSCPNGSYFVVGPGHTFYTIAKFFGVSLDELLRANPNLDPDRMIMGQWLCIPNRVQPVHQGSDPQTITSFKSANSNLANASVSSSSNPSSHSNSHANAVANTNPNVNVSVNVNAGAPSGTPEKQAESEAKIDVSGMMTYLIQPGETIQMIAQKFHTTVAALRRVNPEVNLDYLQPGQKINIAHHWSLYTHEQARITFLYPGNWQRICNERYEGADGFFYVTFVPGGTASLEDICWQEAYATNRPYGSQPSVQREFIRGQEARMILPAPDQPVATKEQAALIFRAPGLVLYGGQVCNYVVIFASKHYIHEIARTVDFK